MVILRTVSALDIKLDPEEIAALEAPCVPQSAVAKWLKQLGKA